MTVGERGTIPGVLSNLKCPEMTRVQLITNVDDTESFILGQSACRGTAKNDRRYEQDRDGRIGDEGSKGNSPE